MENLSFIYLRYFKFELINLFQWFKYFECTELSKSALLWNDWQGIQYFIEFGSFWKAFNFVDIGIHNFEPIALQKFKLHRYYPEKILRRISDLLFVGFHYSMPLWNFFRGKPTIITEEDVIVQIIFMVWSIILCSNFSEIENVQQYSIWSFVLFEVLKLDRQMTWVCESCKK